MAIQAAAIRHDENFVNDVKKLYAKYRLRAYPDYDFIYALWPGTQEYMLLLDFIISELEGLPFDNSFGNPCLKRKDAREVTDSLIGYLKNQSARLHASEKWNKDTSGIEAVFAAPGEYGAEVFKNQAEADSGIRGICYSLDLKWSWADSPSYTELGFVLDRYLVDSAKGRELSVERNGSIELFFSGRIRIDLSAYSAVIHRMYTTRN